MEINKIYNENCLDTMARMPDEFIDLTVTSPPYDNLRDYKGYSFDFEPIARELFRVTKKGGVVVWIVNDATVKGSETGTSFRQALYFKEIGFNLHDTMIWRKTNPTPTDPRIPRYTPSFEYMFILSKGRPLHGSLLRTECKTAGTVRKSKGSVSQLKKDGTQRTDRIEKRYNTETKSTKILDNVVDCSITNNGKTGHPATFPDQLVDLHIDTWSNEMDLIYDPFMGSGTSASRAILKYRNYIGSEINVEYCEIISERVRAAQDEVW